MSEDVKNIRNLKLIDRLYNLFKTEGGSDVPPQLFRNVQPIVDMQQFNKTTIMDTETLSAKTTAEVIDLAVPTGKKWIVSVVNVATSGTRDMNVKIFDPAKGQSVRVAYTASATDVLSWTPLGGLELTEGFIIEGTYGTGSAANYYLVLLYIEQDV